jgi:hypothetical protein
MKIIIFAYAFGSSHFDFRQILSLHAQDSFVAGIVFPGLVFPLQALGRELRSDLFFPPLSWFRISLPGARRPASPFSCRSRDMESLFRSVPGFLFPFQLSPLLPVFCRSAAFGRGPL